MPHTIKLKESQPCEDLYKAVLTPFDADIAAFTVRRRLLVAVDASAAASQAVKWTLDNFARDGDLLTLCTVVPASETAGPDTVFDDDMPTYAIPITDPSKVEALTNAALEDGETTLLELARMCQEAGVPVECIVCIEKVYGPISEALARVADSTGAAAVVVASTGKGWLKKLWAGSTSDGLAHEQKCRAVVILHGTDAGLPPEPEPVPAADDAGHVSA